MSLIEGFPTKNYNRMIHCSILLPLLHLMSLIEGFLSDDLRKILHGGQRMAKVQNGEEILPKVSTPSRVHKHYRRQTDRFAIAKTRTDISHDTVNRCHQFISKCKFSSNQIIRYIADRFL